MNAKQNVQLPSLFAIAALVVLLLLAGISRAQNHSAKPLVVGSEEDYPPFSIGKSEEAAGGFTLELWKAVAAEQKLSYTVRVEPFRKILEDFKAGQIDVLINLAQSEERSAFADFSVPHVIVQGAIFVRRDESRIRSEEDFAGKEILVLNADLAHDYAASKGWQLVLVDSVADGLKLLASGKHDAMLVSRLVGMQTLLEEKIYNVMALKAKAGFSQKFSFAVKKGNSQLLAKLNEGLAAAKASGTQDALYEKWFGVFEVRQVTIWDVLTYLGPLAIIGLILAGVSQVRQRERKKADDTLRERQERLRAALTASGTGTFRWNIRTNELSWDEPLDALFGLPPGQTVRSLEKFIATVHPDDRPGVVERCEMCAREGADFDMEFRVIWPDGAVHWLDDHGRVFFSEDGRPLYMTGACVDVTERKKGEEALRASVEFTNSLISSMQDGFSVLDANGLQVDVNPAFCTMTGFEREEIIGTGAPFPYWPPEEYVRIQAALNATMKGNVTDFELNFMRRSGERFPVIVSPYAVKDQAGDTISYCATVKDITAPRRAKIERELLDRRVQETQKLESLGVLAGGIAHDFNNLLTAILGNASVAQLKLPAGSPVHEFLERINETSLRAADLCKQMLAYSGRGHFVVQRLELGKLVEQTAQLLQISISKRAQLQFHLAPGLPPVELDATQMRQVFMNLVINASEAIGDSSGEISISTGLTHVDQDYLRGNLWDTDLAEGDYVFLDVTDNGLGMSAETQARIFDPFFTTKFTGRGLGLAAVLGIVRGHKGAIRVDSALGRGTTFKLFFPAVAGASETAKTTQEANPTWQGKGTVLVVDDEEMMRSVVAKMMPLLGFDHVLAADGREAVEIFRAHPSQFTLVLLDLTMPCMDGEQTFAELRRLQPDARVVLMSGFNAHEAQGRFKGKGLANFLQKPFTIAALRTAIQEVLDS